MLLTRARIAVVTALIWATVIAFFAAAGVAGWLWGPWGVVGAGAAVAAVAAFVIDPIVAGLLGRPGRCGSR